jgi:pyruvate dehydrogenase complex dehydrogenase (E1) component
LPELTNLRRHNLELVSVLTTYTAICQPTIVFAYTIKGWGFADCRSASEPFVPLNSEQIDRLEEEMGITRETNGNLFLLIACRAFCHQVAERLLFN